MTELLQRNTAAGQRPPSSGPGPGSLNPKSQPFPFPRVRQCIPKKRWQNAMTTTQTLPPVRADSALTLSGVLASALPHDLGTARGPSRYTVPAVFSRRPQPREIDLLHGSNISRRLAEAGYGDVELRVSDRRLLITNTNLMELKEGLAHLLGLILTEVSAKATDERTERAEELDALGLIEEQRLESIRQAAAEIHFD